MNPSQSTTILRDVNLNINRQLSSRPTTSIDQTKSRSKSLSNNNNNNNKRYLQYNENDNPINRSSKPIKQQSKLYTIDKYQPQNININNNYQLNNNNMCSLWSIPILAEEDTSITTKQSYGTSISNQILSITQNQHSYLILQTNNTFKAIQKHNNIENISLSNTVNNFFNHNKSIKLQQIHATTFGTFFIDNHNVLYAMGLNDRGQLGIKSTNIITQPTEVTLPFSYSVSNNKPKSSSLLLKNKPTTTVSQKQKITKIQGGPFYTVILTTSNKAYYTGISYENNDLQNDQYITTFKQITIKNNPIIIDIACGLTSTIFLTQNNKIYIMGIFGDNVFPHPTELQFSIRAQIKQCKTVNDSVYLLLKNGQLYKADMNRKMPIITEIKLGQLINNNSTDINHKQRKIVVESLHVTNNQLIFTTKQYLNKKDNTSFSYKYFIQIKNNQNQQNQIQDQIKQLHLPQLQDINIKQIFLVSSHLNILIKSQQAQKLIQKQKQFTQKILINKKQIDSYMIKIKQLQQENLKLKKDNTNLVKQKKLTTPKKQDKLTLSNINYNFQKQVIPRSFNNDLEIEFSQIKLTKKIAQGGYGIIYKGEWKKTEVAVKIFKIDQNNTNSVKQFVSQCRAMQALRHPNIVMFLGICMKKPNFAIVLQYCQGGTLWSLLQNHKIDLPWKERVRLAIQTAKSINYLHDRKNPIVHRDLKSLNVLLDANRRVKLADFGWTKSLQSYMTSKIGTYQWMAPQVLTGQKYSEKADVFSFSIILWEIASRQPPYRNINGIQVAYDVANKQYRPTIPNDTPEFFQKLITQCWEKDPQKRPSFKEIMEILDKQFNSMN